MFQIIQQDFREFYDIAQKFWKPIPDEAYARRTGTREKDWTLLETLAHLLSFAQLLNRAVDAALRDEKLDLNGVSQREDLLAWNTKEIARLSQAPSNALIMRFLKELEQAGNSLHTLTPEQSETMVFVPFYNRPARVIDFIEWQLSHAGVIHAAQVTRPLEQAPLWEGYSPDFKHRILERFTRHFSMAYWQDYGSEESEVINLHIGGASGGDWHLVAASDGGSRGDGVLDDANYDVFFDSSETFFGLFTFHLSFKDAMLAGKVRFASDFRDTMRLLRLFTPSPPKD